MGQALQTFLFIMKMILYILRLFVAVYIQSGNVNDLLYCMSGSLPISCLFLFLISTHGEALLTHSPPMTPVLCLTEQDSSIPNCSFLTLSLQRTLVPWAGTQAKRNFSGSQELSIRVTWPTQCNLFAVTILSLNTSSALNLLLTSACIVGCL